MNGTQNKEDKKMAKLSSGFSGLVFGCLAVLALAGCESIRPEGFSIEGMGISFDGNRELREPERAGEFATFVHPELRRIEEVPALIVFPSDIDKVFLTKQMLWGTHETVASVPVASLIKKQFLRAVSEHFHPLVGDQQPAIRVEVNVLGIILSREEGAVKSEVTVNIRIRDEVKNLVCHDKRYYAQAAMPWDGGELIPDAVYKSIQDVAASFLVDIASDRTLIARLEGISPDAAKVRKPSFKSFEIKPKNSSDVVTGSCKLSCNDWDEGRAANWLRAQLERRCENQLGVEAARVRLVYDKSEFVGAEREWHVEFTAFARSEMVLNYNSTTLSGTCVADFGLMGKSAEKAADALKDYVMQEMDKRAGVQRSGAKGPKAQVRFDDFKTDQRYALTYCSFRLVY